MSSATRSSCWQGADLTDPARSYDLGAARERGDRATSARAVPINVVNGSLP